MPNLIFHVSAAANLPWQHPRAVSDSPGPCATWGTGEGGVTCLWPANPKSLAAQRSEPVSAALLEPSRRFRDQKYEPSCWWCGHCASIRPNPSVVPCNIGSRWRASNHSLAGLCPHCFLLTPKGIKSGSTAHHAKRRSPGEERARSGMVAASIDSPPPLDVIRVWLPVSLKESARSNLQPTTNSRSSHQGCVLRLTAAPRSSSCYPNTEVSYSVPTSLFNPVGIFLFPHHTSVNVIGSLPSRLLASNSIVAKPSNRLNASTYRDPAIILHGLYRLRNTDGHRPAPRPFHRPIRPLCVRPRVVLRWVRSGDGASFWTPGHLGLGYTSTDGRTMKRHSRARLRRICAASQY